MAAGDKQCSNSRTLSRTKKWSGSCENPRNMGGGVERGGEGREGEKGHVRNRHVDSNRNRLPHGDAEEPLGALAIRRLWLNRHLLPFETAPATSPLPFPPLPSLPIHCPPLKGLAARSLHTPPQNYPDSAAETESVAMATPSVGDPAKKKPRWNRIWRGKGRGVEGPNLDYNIKRKAK